MCSLCIRMYTVLGIFLVAEVNYPTPAMMKCVFGLKSVEVSAHSQLELRQGSMMKGHLRDKLPVAWQSEGNEPFSFYILCSLLDCCCPHPGWSFHFPRQV